MAVTERGPLLFKTKDASPRKSPLLERKAESRGKGCGKGRERGEGRKEEVEREGRVVRKYREQHTNTRSIRVPPSPLALPPPLFPPSISSPSLSFPPLPSSPQAGHFLSAHLNANLPVQEEEKLPASACLLRRSILLKYQGNVERSIQFQI